MAIMARPVKPGLHVPLLALPGQSDVCSVPSDVIEGRKRRIQPT